MSLLGQRNGSRVGNASARDLNRDVIAYRRARRDLNVHLVQAGEARTKAGKQDRRRLAADSHRRRQQRLIERAAAGGRDTTRGQQRAVWISVHGGLAKAGDIQLQVVARVRGLSAWARRAKSGAVGGQAHAGRHGKRHCEPGGVGGGGHRVVPRRNQRVGEEEHAGSRGDNRCGVRLRRAARILYGDIHLPVRRFHGHQNIDLPDTAGKREDGCWRAAEQNGDAVGAGRGEGRQIVLGAEPRAKYRHDGTGRHHAGGMKAGAVHHASNSRRGANRQRRGVAGDTRHGCDYGIDSQRSVIGNGEVDGDVSGRAARLNHAGGFSGDGHGGSDGRREVRPDPGDARRDYLAPSGLRYRGDVLAAGRVAKRLIDGKPGRRLRTGDGVGFALEFRRQGGYVDRQRVRRLPLVGNHQRLRAGRRGRGHRGEDVNAIRRYVDSATLSAHADGVIPARRRGGERPINNQLGTRADVRVQGGEVYKAGDLWRLGHSRRSHKQQRDEQSRTHGNPPAPAMVRRI